MRHLRFGSALLVAVTAGALYLSAPSTHAQAGAALTGEVLSAEEGKMEGVVVSARREGATFTVSVVSDKDGKYSFPRTHLEPGKYAITMRAAGYDLAGPVSADVKAGTAAKADLKLQKAKNLAAQLSSAEWMMSINASDEDKSKFTHILMSCNYCHTLQRVFLSKHTQETLLPAMHRMVKYYADGTAKSNDNRRGRAALIQEPGRVKSLEESPNWGSFQDQPRTWIADFVAKYNLSGGRTAPAYPLKTLPRPKGKATRVIITEYDMPTAGTVAHDMDIDSKGVVWYTDESAQMLGKFEPKTATFTEIRPPVLPAIPKGEMEGTRDVIVGHDDKIWFPVRVPGNHAVISRYDPATNRLDLVEGVGGQFIGLAGDGYVWAGGARIDPKTLKVVDRYSYQGAKELPPGQHGGYHNVYDKNGNVWVATYRGPGGIIGIDVKTKAVTWVPVPGLKARRGKVDHKTNRFYFAEYLGDKAGMFDINTGKVQRWDVGKYYTPYTASTEDSKGRVYVSSNGAERLLRIDPATNEIVEYLWPTELDAKKIAIDPTSKNPVIWFANKRTARISKVEPLD
jgi:virginiamycin B lyase